MAEGLALAGGAIVTKTAGKVETAATGAGPPERTAQLRLELLGGLRLTRDGAPMTGLAYAKSRALLAYLAVTGQPHSREALATLLWSDLPGDAARQNLREVLSNLRRVAGRYLLITRETVAFDRTAPTWLDVDAFHAALDRPGATRLVERLRAAVDLYHGDLLAGFAVHDAPAFDEWLAAQRERLRQLALHALHELAVFHTERSDHAAGIAYITRLLALDPWREDAHRQLMLLLAGSGQRDAALAQYARCRRVLTEELGVDPDPETTSLAERIRTGEIVARHSPVGIGAGEGNGAGVVVKAAVLPDPRPSLPRPPTPLLGRDAELAAIARLLSRPAVRLVTIVGPPGVGKTRLALEVAAHRLVDYAGGVWFVDLAPVSDPDIVPDVIAQALGVRERGGRPLLEDIADALHDQHVLLVLDNCEQVLGAAPPLAALLAACPRLVILATSREPLRLRGEYELLLAPLALPNLACPPVLPVWSSQSAAPAMDGALDLEALSQYPAIALFVERAAAVLPAFVLTAENAWSVAALCVRLDGLPLALELAAARLRFLPLPALVERLAGHRHLLSVLTGGPRDLPARQHTLRATIDWSYHLLGEKEQRFFRRLGVFAGGFTLAAAEAVVPDTAGRPHPRPVSAAAIQDGLERLAGASLLTWVPAGQTGGQTVEEPRFGLLEAIREYALEQLEASGEVDVVRARHAACYLGLAEQGQARLQGPEQEIWIDRLERDHANFRAALQWWSEHGDVERALRLGAALSRFWIAWGYRAEGRERLLALLATSDAALSAPPVRDRSSTPVFVSPATRANALVAAATLIGHGAPATTGATGGSGSASINGASGSPTARALVHEAMAIWRRVTAEDAGTAGDALAVVAGVQALGEEYSGPPPTAQASALLRAAPYAGDYGTARSLIEEAVNIWRRLGDQHAVVHALSNLGVLANGFQQVEARRFLEESLAISRQLGDRRSAGEALDRLATVAHLVGDLDTAQRLYEDAIGEIEAAGDRALEAWPRLNLGFLALSAGDLTTARTRAAEALAIRREHGPRAPLAHVVALCAALAAAEGLPERALLLDGAVEAFSRRPPPRERNIGLPALYRIWLDRSLAMARQTLGDAEAGSIRAKGTALTAVQVMTEVLSYVDGSAGQAG
jgi:predicted ATPase/DNA-binding SARP family transcriptional activator